MIDPTSIAGKWAESERRVPLVVVGAGAAGIAAATAAARAGVETVLIDEHPVTVDLMAMEVPYAFGQRFQPGVGNRSAMLERIAQANPALEEAVEAGVDVQLGTVVWGAFRNSPTVRELPGPLLGLSDGERSWLLGYQRLVVAAGARDLGIAYAGWEKAGAMGANGAWSLLTHYRALAAEKLLILGSGNLALRTAELALKRGIGVAGIVEVLPAVRGDAALRRRLEEQGVRFYPEHTIREARGRGDAVESAVLIRVGSDLQPIRGSEVEMACDTVVTALGLVPNVELLNVLDCRLQFRSEYGGWTPETDRWQRTSVPSVFAAGDCAGWHDGLVLDGAIAANQGRLAGTAAATTLGAIAPERARALRAELAVPSDAPGEVHSYWQAWHHAQINVGGWDTCICACEEVTRREVAEVQPPRYLNWQSDEMRARSLKTLLKDGPVSQDQVKRLTRAGMGYCQGRRCREQIALLLADEAAVAVGSIPLATYRPPVRPLPLGVLWPQDEPQHVRDEWVRSYAVTLVEGGGRSLRPKPTVEALEAVPAVDAGKVGGA